MKFFSVPCRNFLADCWLALHGAIVLVLVHVMVWYFEVTFEHSHFGERNGYLTVDVGNFWNALGMVVDDKNVGIPYPLIHPLHLL